jgi:hypothetical protein
MCSTYDTGHFELIHDASGTVISYIVSTLKSTGRSCIHINNGARYFLEEWITVSGKSIATKIVTIT